MFSQPKSASSSFSPMSFLDTLDPVKINFDSNSKKLPNQKSFWQRGYAISRPQDICIQNEETPLENDYIAYLDSLELGTSKLRENSNDDDLEMRLFSYGKKLTKGLENKRAFIAWCRFNGIIVPDFDIIIAGDSDLEDKLSSLYESKGPLIARAVDGSGGVGTYEITGDIDKLTERIVSENSPDKELVIQKFYDVESSPSGMGYISSKGTQIFNTTQQITKNSSYAGTLIDVSEGGDVGNVSSETKVIAEKLHKTGFRGFFGVDFIRLKNGTVYPVELNDRITAAFFPNEIGFRLKSQGKSIDKIEYLPYKKLTRSYDSWRDFKKSSDYMELGGNDRTVFLHPGLLSDGFITTLRY